MKKYVILDIDRTIINGTSWYHACSCPNLLIDEYNIDRFKELNNKMYVHGTSKDRYEFRKQTFELINKRVSESAYRKLSECGCADEILIGQNVNEVFFEAVGIYTYKKLMKSDEDCKKIVDFIYKYYFGDIEFIFLTSGYEPFMKGLVKEYMKSFHKNCTWRTIGSTIKFSNGCIYLKEVMTQEKKFQFVKKIIDYGNRVVFLADDSVEEKELFSVVFRNGGYAFNVRYDEKLHESNWHELINDIEDENVFLSYLMKNSEVALSDCKKVQNNFFRLHMNEIGVICLNDIEYQIFLGSFNRDKKIVEYIKKVSYKKEEKYYLRGRYYYYWLPSYITGSLESKYAGWKKIVIDGIDIIEHIARYNIKENKYACILSYVICDHLLSVLYLAMYCAEEDVLDRERNVISSYRHIENSVCILNKILFSVFDNKIEYSNLDSLVKELKSISFEDMDIIRENEKFLLELDNYNTIYEAVYNIIDNLKVKAQKIDKVIYFAYGGISLGYSSSKISIEWTMQKIILACSCVCSGVLIQGALFLMFASLSFFIVKTDNLRNVLYWNIKSFMGYPISIYPKLIQYFVVYIIPLAFVNYFPSQLLMGVFKEGNIFPAVYISISAALGMVLFGLSYLFWRFSLRFYASTGS